MAENNLGKIKLGRVLQTMFVRGRIVDRTRRPQVIDTSFDSSQRQGSQPFGSISRSHLS